MKELINVINDLMIKSTHFVHPIGAFYLKFQLLFKVLFVGLIVDQAFDGDILICDTKQLGCSETCINRFAPITFKKLWQLELWLVLLGTGLFMLFVYMNTHVINPDKFTFGRRFMNIHEKRLNSGKIVIHSKFISIGYVLVLVMRVFGELYFLKLQYQLGIGIVG